MPRRSGTRCCPPAGNAIGKAGISAAAIAAIGITNQRETTLIWERDTGRPIHRAIVWQDRRTADRCQTLKSAGYEPGITAKTGLLLDPYFSGTKIAWMLDMVPGAAGTRGRGELAFGTVDSFLIWQGSPAARCTPPMPPTPRARCCSTSTVDVWDDELLSTLRCPARHAAGGQGLRRRFTARPSPRCSAAAIPIRGVAGDQQAATIGQACFEPGMVKSTYGTGCFALLNTGRQSVVSSNRLLTTIAYQLDGKRTYALEGSIFVAGAAVQWLRDGLKIIPDAAASGGAGRRRRSRTRTSISCRPSSALARPIGMPRRAAPSIGLTRGTGPASLPAPRSRRSAIRRAISWRRCAATGMAAAPPERCCGSMAAWSPPTGRCSASPTLLDAPVDRPKILETTALGAAYLAGLDAGLYPARRNSPSSGSSSGASRRRWTRLRGAANSPAGGMRCRGLCRGGSEVRPDHGL